MKRNYVGHKNQKHNFPGKLKSDGKNAIRKQEADFIWQRPAATNEAFEWDGSGMNVLTRSVGCVQSRGTELPINFLLEASAAAQQVALFHSESLWFPPLTQSPSVTDRQATAAEAGRTRRDAYVTAASGCYTTGMFTRTSRPELTHTQRCTTSQTHTEHTLTGGTRWRLENNLDFETPDEGSRCSLAFMTLRPKLRQQEKIGWFAVGGEDGQTDRQRDEGGQMMRRYIGTQNGR